MFKYILTLAVLATTVTFGMEKNEPNPKVPTLTQLGLKKAVDQLTSEDFLKKFAQNPNELDRYTALPYELQEAIIEQIKPNLWRYITPKVKILQGHERAVASVAYNPQGTQLASGSFDKTIRIWDVTTEKTLQKLTGHTDLVWQVTYNNDGTQLASSSFDKTIRIWDVATGKALKILNANSLVRSIAYDPNGSQLASGLSNNTILIWELKSGNIIKTLNGHTASVSQVTYNHDGSQLASGCFSVGDARIFIWDVKTGNTIKTFSNEPSTFSLTFSPDSHQIAAATPKIIRIWDVETGKLLKTLDPHIDGPIQSITFNPQGTQLASGSLDEKIHIWDVKTGQTITTLLPNSGVESLAYNPDGTQLAAGLDYRSNKIQIWDVSYFITPDMTLKEVMEKLSKEIQSKKNK